MPFFYLFTLDIPYEMTRQLPSQSLQYEYISKYDWEFIKSSKLSIFLLPSTPITYPYNNASIIVNTVYTEECSHAKRLCLIYTT